MTLLHVIYPNGSTRSTEYTGELKYACPPFSYIKELIGNKCDCVEHVSVLWKGKGCHMFVDETGCYKNLEPNARASRIYFNASFRHMGEAEYIYHELARDPHIGREDGVPVAVLEFLQQASPIIGVAVLWEGEME